MKSIVASLNLPLIILLLPLAVIAQPRIEYGNLLDIPHDSGVVNVFVDAGLDLATREGMKNEFSRLTGLGTNSRFSFVVRDRLQEADVVLAYSTRIDLYAGPSVRAADPR